MKKTNPFSAPIAQLVVANDNLATAVTGSTAMVAWQDPSIHAATIAVRDANRTLRALIETWRAEHPQDVDPVEILQAINAVERIIDGGQPSEILTAVAHAIALVTDWAASLP